MSDLISRQETLSILSNLNSAWVGYEKVSRLPTIDAVPVVHGEWIDHQYKEFPIGRYECSVCGKRHDMEWDYCPNCGAKMEV